FAGRVTTFGIERDADVRAVSVVDRGIEGTSAQITTPRGTVELTTPLVGRGNLANILAATAVALEFDLPLADVAEQAAAVAAAAVRPASHRGEVVRLAHGITVIDDSYNANPTATKLAIEVLARSAGSRRIAVIGEMLELGERSSELHADVGRVAAHAGLDAIIAVRGAPARAPAGAAGAGGGPPR